MKTAYLLVSCACLLEFSSLEATPESAGKPSISLHKQLEIQSLTNSSHYQKQAIWQHGDSGIFLTDDSKFWSLQSSEVPQLAILMPTAWSDFAKQLQSDPSTIMFIPFEFALQLTVVELTSQEQLNQLALAAHQNRGFCGAIEVLPITHQVYSLAQTTFRLPAYHSRAYFGQLSNWLEAVNVEQMISRIIQLESFGTRFHATTEGIAVVAEIADWFAQEGDGISQFEVTTEVHPITAQNSIIARITGTTHPDEVVILGAHLDTITPTRSLAPGADDNASGIASLLEVLRILQEKGAQFQRTIEFHAYGAEEVGLIGSRDIASKYRQQGKNIIGMMQIDMNQWGSEADLGRVFLLTNHTSEELRRRAKNWLQAYITDEYTVATIQSGATSDHKAWFDQGFPTLFAFENPQLSNPRIHTTQDTTSNLNNPELSRRITQLALLFVTYSAGLMELEQSYQNQISDIFPGPTEHDLYLAIGRDGNDYTLAISAPLATEYVEICPVIERLDSGCQAERLVLRKHSERNGRQLFYYPQNIALDINEAWRIEAFNTQDQLLSIRQVVLEVTESARNSNN